MIPIILKQSITILTIPEEIKELRDKYSSGIPIKELKTGFFENYTEIAIRNIVTYKTYNNI